MTGPIALVLLGLGAAAGLAVLAWPGPLTEPPAVRRGRTGSHRRNGYVATTVGALVHQRPGARSRGDAHLDVHLLDALAAALEAGMPTQRALCLALDSAAVVDRLPPAWEDLRRAAELGLPLAPSWTRLARRTGSPTVAAAARAWAVATASGSPLAAAVRASAQAARERHRLLRAVEAATAGARATATVLSLLPVAGIGLAAVLGIGPVSLYASRAALASALLGVVLLGAGHLVVRAMAARVVRGTA